MAGNRFFLHISPFLRFSVLQVSDLHNQLRNLEQEESSDTAASSLTVTRQCLVGVVLGVNLQGCLVTSDPFAELREQLRDVLEAQAADQAQIGGKISGRPAPPRAFN